MKIGFEAHSFRALRQNPFSPLRGPLPHKWGSGNVPTAAVCRFPVLRGSSGEAGEGVVWLAICLLVIRHNPQAQIAQLLRGRQGWGAHHQVLGVLVHGEHDDVANVGGAS